jgi:hypothetical protein
MRGTRIEDVARTRTGRKAPTISRSPRDDDCFAYLQISANKGTDNANKGTDNANKGTDNANKGTAQSARRRLLRIPADADGRLEPNAPPQNKGTTKR